MKDLLLIFQEIEQEIQSLTEKLSLFSKTNALRISEEWNTKKETAKILGVSLRTIERLISSGQLPYSKVNGSVYTKTEDIEKLLTENYINKKLIK